jgi:transposase InsO family protein/transposase-like protein
MKEKHCKRYAPEIREKVARLHLEEGYTRGELSEEFHCSKNAVGNWIRQYQESGGEGSNPSGRGVAGGIRAPGDEDSASKAKTINAVDAKIVELKETEPTHGIRRISDILKRFFFLKASPEKVRTVLHEAKLMSPPTAKRRTRNDPKPRFFERATPNQMWQSDICTFRLAGQNAYLIGFMDDYSRYMVGLGLYRSQTAENVLETLKTAVGEYGVPKEMLTDNGRQYTNWRGTTRFEKYLAQERMKHIKSSPHHPMTLGKIERFWQSIQQEFLFRAQFDSFESARERLALWTKYYNYKRPNQGIDGLCPADRYFEVQSELKKTLEKGVQENVLELALRGKPKSPFYMVGRLGGQNVAIRAEKGKIHMHVDEPGVPEGKVLEYDMNAEENNHGGDTTAEPGACGAEAKAAEAGDSPAGEGQGGACDLDGAAEGERALPGFGSEPDPVGPLGGAGLGGDATGSGAEKQEAGAGTEDARLAPGTASGEESSETAGEHGEAGGAHRADPGEGQRAERERVQAGLNGEGEDGERKTHQEGAEGEGAVGAETRRDHLQRKRRPLLRLRWRR